MIDAIYNCRQGDIHSGHIIFCGKCKRQTLLSFHHKKSIFHHKIYHDPFFCAIIEKTKLYGSVIYNGEKNVEDKVTVPLTTDGWHLYIAQD